MVNGWEFVYELSDCGFESSSSHLSTLILWKLLMNFGIKDQALKYKTLLYFFILTSKFKTPYWETSECCYFLTSEKWNFISPSLHLFLFVSTFDKFYFCQGYTISFVLTITCRSKETPFPNFRGLSNRICTFRHICIFSTLSPVEVRHDLDHFQALEDCVHYQNDIFNKNTSNSMNSFIKNAGCRILTLNSTISVSWNFW